MKLIYVAGPYRDENWGAVVRNVSRAADVAADLLCHWYAVICPHTMTHTFEMYDLPDEAFLACGLEQVRRCDAVVLVDSGPRRWWQSSGTRDEVRLAADMGKPVYQNVGALFAECPMSMAQIVDCLGRVPE